MKTETLEQFIYRKHRPQSAKTYLFNLQHFFAKHPKAKSYVYKDIVIVMDEIRQRYPIIGTCNGILSSIKRYYDYLIETKQRNDHPCRNFRIKGESISKRNKMHFQDLFTPAELEELLDRPSPYKTLRLRNKVLISFLIYQALTSDDIIRLTLKDIDLDKGIVYVKAGAKLSRRELSLTRLQKEYLTEYINTVRPKMLQVNSDSLIIHHRGLPGTVDAINGMFDCLRSWFPTKKLNPKTIRMSVIANWFNVYKLPLEQVQLLAGHKWPSSTLRYKREDIHEQREKINMWHPLN